MDDQPGSKPVLGVDDLLLGLTHHWSRDKSVFPTEDDRLDLPLIMLFQAYTACRPAELVDGTKKRGESDPLLDDPKPGEINSIDTDMIAAEEWDMEIDSSQSESEPDMQSISEQSGPDRRESDQYVFDLYSNDHSEHLHTTGKRNIYIRPLQTNSIHINAKKEPKRVHKALCYEDICLWITKDPNGGRDVLAMEVFFRFHKGVDNKPKP